MIDVLRNLTIAPLEFFIKFIFLFIDDLCKNPGISLIFVSIFVQTIILPLYNKSDALQEQERNKQKSMEKWVTHIKKTFKGDERFMMLSTYYRQQNYKPVYALKCSVSLLLQIPFFMAAYNVLSSLPSLNGSTFLFIRDLGQPDSLFTIGRFAINVLPIAMTLINIISGYIYTKGFSLKEKLQLYLMALVFLVLLYNSPSGLVLYWTMNNVYSLGKSIFTKLVKDKKKVLCISSSLLGILLFFASYLKGIMHSTKLVALFVFILVVFQLPFIIHLLSKKGVKFNFGKTDVSFVDSKAFVFELVILAVLFGAVIPLSVFSASPMEFYNQEYGPLHLFKDTFTFYVGLFVVWFSIFYLFMSDKGKYYFSKSLYVLIAVCLLNFLAFGRNLGNISALLIYDEEIDYSKLTILINLVLNIAVAVVFWLLYDRKKLSKLILEVLCLSSIVISIFYYSKVSKTVKKESSYIETSASEEDKQIFKLSKTENNVVVFMLDRAINAYIPYILEEKPELKDSFDGFVYYPNTISFGMATNTSTPSLFGGYEYTPERINARSSEKLVDKQNEALKVMPVLFADNNYDVTVIDPPWAGYTWTPDLSIYDGYENIKAYNTSGMYYEEYLASAGFANYKSQQHWNVKMYSILRCIPILLDRTVYDDGRYYVDDLVGNGIPTSYITLTHLSDMTYITEGKASFLCLQNDLTHHFIMTGIPSYDPYNLNSTYDEEIRVSSDGSEITIKPSNDTMTAYCTNMAAIIQLAKWFDWMKENDVYDNTRIILVSDHSREIGQFESMNFEGTVNMEGMNPLMMVKDFNATGFTVCNDFMTLADVPTLATEGIIENATNPFSGNVLNSSDKENGALVNTSGNWDAYTNNGNAFDMSDGKWFLVKDNIFDSDNWTEIDK